MSPSHRRVTVRERERGIFHSDGACLHAMHYKRLKFTGTLGTVKGQTNLGIFFSGLHCICLVVWS